MAKKKSIQRPDDLTLVDVLARFKGEPLAILCARYWYRGIVAEVGRDVVVMTSPRAVEITGPSNSPTPNQEDQIPSDLTIATQAIEQFCQPAWTFHELGDREEAEE